MTGRLLAVLGARLLAVTIARCGSGASPKPSSPAPTSDPPASGSFPPASISFPPPSVTAVEASVAGDPARLPGTGVVAPGTYRVGDPFAATFDVTFEGDGWDIYAVDSCCLLVEHNFHQAPGLLFLAAWTIDGLFADPCQHTPAAPFGPSVDDLVEAFRAVPAYGATKPTQATVGGLDATRLAISLPPGTDIGDCLIAQYWLWASEGEIARYVPAGYSSGEDALWILDVGGTRIVIDGVLSDPTDADRAQLDQIVESIVFVEP